MHVLGTEAARCKRTETAMNVANPSLIYSTFRRIPGRPGNGVQLVEKAYDTGTDAMSAMSNMTITYAHQWGPNRFASSLVCEEPALKLI
jgi:hypothetical protein